MTNKDVKKARKEYVRRQKEKEKLIALKKELVELSHNSNVKRYLEIVDVEDEEVPSEQKIIRDSFNGIPQDEDDFKVYLYMGMFTCSRNFDENDSQVFDRNVADYLCYCNIGNVSDSVNIKPSMQEQFEQENIVLKPKCTIGAQSKYYELQMIYYEQLLKSDLRSKKKILEKVKENL